MASSINSLIDLGTRDPSITLGIRLYSPSLRRSVKQGEFAIGKTIVRVCQFPHGLP